VLPDLRANLEIRGLSRTCLPRRLAVGYRLPAGLIGMAQILIIDDDVMLLDLLQLHLSGKSVQVRVAEDAVIALRSIIQDPPDLILLDLGLPYMNGMEVLRAVKGDASTGHIPVIVITGHDNEEEYLKARALGADAFLNKPVQRDDLINEIFSRLTRQVARRSSAPTP